MKIATFIAIIEPAKEGFGVYFPDLPGCTSAGATQGEAARNALDALALHLDGIIEDGEAIPEPAPLEKIAVPKGAAPVLVSATLPGKVERINITMDEGTLAAADRLAKESGLTRSGYFAVLVRNDLVHTRPTGAIRSARHAGGKITTARTTSPRGEPSTYILKNGRIIGRAEPAPFVAKGDRIVPRDKSTAKHKKA